MPGSSACATCWPCTEKPDGDQPSKVTDVELVFASDEIGDAPLTLRVRDIPWTLALELALEPSGCEMRRVSPKRIVIDRPPRMTAEFENADVRDVYRSIGSSAGVHVDVDLEVAGTITMWLYDAPWRDALEASAESLGHVVIEKPDGTFRVAAAGTRGGR